MDNQRAILRAIWLAAYATGEKKIFYDSKIDAKRMQMHLYGVYKPIRKDPSKDPELFTAYQACEVAITFTDQFVRPWCVIVRHKPEDHVNSLVKDAMAQLDLSIPKEQSGPEPSDDGDAFLKKLAGESPE